MTGRNWWPRSTAATKYRVDFLRGCFRPHGPFRSHMLRDVLLANAVAVMRRACSGTVDWVIVGDTDLLRADAMAYVLLVNNGSL